MSNHIKLVWNKSNGNDIDTIIFSLPACCSITYKTGWYPSMCIFDYFHCNIKILQETATSKEAKKCLIYKKKWFSWLKSKIHNRSTVLFQPNQICRSICVRCYVENISFLYSKITENCIPRLAPSIPHCNRKTSTWNYSILHYIFITFNPNEFMYVLYVLVVYILVFKGYNGTTAAATIFILSFRFSLFSSSSSLY